MPGIGGRPPIGAGPTGLPPGGNGIGAGDGLLDAGGGIGFPIGDGGVGIGARPGGGGGGTGLDERGGGGGGGGIWKFSALGIFPFYRWQPGGFFNFTSSRTSEP